MRRMIITIFIIIIFLFGYYNYKSSNDVDSKQDRDITNKREDNEVNILEDNINVNINGVNFTATLEDNKTTREFINRLPLEITMNELNGNEKYYYFDKDLPSDSKIIGKIKKGDIMLYGDDCLVIFYESFTTSYSYTRIGSIDHPDNLDNVVGKDSITVKITR